MCSSAHNLNRPGKGAHQPIFLPRERCSSAHNLAQGKGAHQPIILPCTEDAGQPQLYQGLSLLHVKVVVWQLCMATMAVGTEILQGGTERACLGGPFFSSSPSPLCLMLMYLTRIPSAFSIPGCTQSSAPSLMYLNVPVSVQGADKALKAKKVEESGSKEGDEAEEEKVAVEYRWWLVADLRTELIRRGAESKGLKAVLVQRLEELDTAQAKGQEQEATDEEEHPSDPSIPSLTTPHAPMRHLMACLPGEALPPTGFTPSHRPRIHPSSLLLATSWRSCPVTACLWT